MRYVIRYPKADRKRFKIIAQTLTEGKTKSVTVKNDTLDSINAQLLKNIITIETATKAVRHIVANLNKKAPEIFNNENSDIFEAFWEARYKRKRIKDKPSARYKFLRAIKALGKVSIQVGDANTIQDAVDENLKGNKHREAIGKLRSILKWLKRDIELVCDKAKHPEVKYVTEKEFKSILSFIDNEKHRLLCEMAFYTGARIGEIFAFEMHHLNELKNQLFISRQLNKEGLLAETKNGKERITFIWPQGTASFKRWLEVKHEIPFNERQQMAKTVKSACYKAFPGIKSKHLKFHDLRHSYAVALVSKGVGLTHVAQCLGDSTKVTEQYYIGFLITSDSIDLIKKTVN